MKKLRDKKIELETDYIDSPKHEFSLKKLLNSNPNGVSDKVIAKILKLTPAEVEEIHNCAMMKLRRALGENEEI